MDLDFLLESRFDYPAPQIGLDMDIAGSIFLSKHSSLKLLLLLLLLSTFIQRKIGKKLQMR